MKNKTNWKYILIVAFLSLVVGTTTFLVLPRTETPLPNFLNIERIGESQKIKTNQEFRDLIIEFLREKAKSKFSEGDVSFIFKRLSIEGNWQPKLILYYQGEVIGKGEGESPILSLALEKSLESLFNNSRVQGLTEKEFGETIFFIEMPSLGESFSFVENEGKGIEIIEGLTAIRELDKNLILEKIKEGKEFLYRVENQEEHGFYKKYDPLSVMSMKNFSSSSPSLSLRESSVFESRLYGPYSASIIYTFLYIYNLEEDKEILKHIEDWAGFLFSMQNKKEGSKSYGAFHYSFYLDGKEKEERFVVGTSALSIFTLLKLYDLENEPKYLESAKLAGDWLLTMQNEDGTMKPYVHYVDEKWLYGQKESLLYEGQVLSALSKLYGATGIKKYLDGAEKIAKRFAQKYEEEQGYIKGEYRDKNPISNSWVVMSLMDFSKVKPIDRYKKVVFELSAEVLGNQRPIFHAEESKVEKGTKSSLTIEGLAENNDDLYNYGSWGGSYSSSGTGWMSEVMAETYKFCLDERRGDCDKYKEGVIRAIRSIIQNTYSKENVFNLENPGMAIGGVFWNKNEKYVRTDSVCHALNSYTIILNYLDEAVLLSIPEEQIDFGLIEK